MIHVRVDLKWVGHGPGNTCPWFWKNREHAMRFGFMPKHDWWNEAIELVRRTWHEHEVRVIQVVLTDILGDPLIAACGRTKNV